jgi:hypothetical protein
MRYAIFGPRGLYLFTTSSPDVVLLWMLAECTYLEVHYVR